MRTCHGLLLISWLALLSRVSDQTPQSVVATIPSRGFLKNVAEERSDAVVESRSQPVLDLEVTGFITKSGDIFELPASRSMGSIEAREEPDLDAGMTMCRYGTIVVYSDSDCNKFFRSPTEILGRPQDGSDLQEDVDVATPVRKKNRVKGNKRNKKKKLKNKNRRKQQQRRKALKRKQQQNQKRRRNKLKNGGNNSQRKNKRRATKNKRRPSANKRRRFNNREEVRSEVDVEEGGDAAPLQFTILLNPH